MNTIRTTLQATLKSDGKTVELDEKLNMPPGRVQISIEQHVARSRPGMLEVLEQIHRDQAAQGRRAMTDEEMEKEIAAMRGEAEEEEERWRTIWGDKPGSPSPGEHS